MYSLALAIWATTSVDAVKTHRTLEMIDAYIRARLREEIEREPRGIQKRVAKALGVSSAHVSNIISPRPTRNPSEEIRRAAAAYFGLSYAELEAAATGVQMQRLVNSDRRK